MSERTMNEHIDTLLPLLVNDDTEMTDFVDKVLPTFKTVDANLEKEQADFIKNYKTATPTPPVVKPSVAPNTSLEALQKQLQELQQKIENEEKQKVLASVRSNFKSELKDVGIKDDKWIDTYLSKIAISEDLDIKEEAKSTLELYNISKAQIPEDATTPYNPGGNSDTKGKVNWDYLK